MSNDLVQQTRFGSLVLLERHGKKADFQCDCGRIVNKSWYGVLDGRIKSCGCFRIKALQVRTVKPIPVGSVFGRLTVIEYDGAHCKCRCECGNTAAIKSTRLRTGHTQSCGCYQKDRARQAATKKIVPGTVFNRLTVIEQRGRFSKCRCECGNVLEVETKKLRAGHVKSCGCLRVDQAHVMSQAKVLPSGEVAFNSLYAQYRAQAATRQFVFELSEDDFRRLTLSSCHYCGKPPQQIKRSLHAVGCYVYNGVDRLENADGYTQANSVASCWMCNSAKHVSSVKDFLDWAACLLNPQVHEVAVVAIMNSPYLKLYNRYKNTARNKRLSFELDKPAFMRLVTAPCRYCGRLPYKLITKGETLMYTGIDRKNNNVGYTLENSVSCCWQCNNAKALGTVAELLEWARRVVNWQRNNTDKLI